MSKHNLDEVRCKINEIDKKMAELFVQRMKASKEVAEYKIEHSLPIVDRNREQTIIHNNAERIEDDVIREYYINFLKSTMDISKAYQTRLMENMVVGYSGVPGAFGHIAAKQMFPNATFIAYPDFNEAYLDCENGKCDAVVLPIENSYAGDVGSVMDLTFSGSLYINQIIELDVVHHLLGTENATKETIREVISHPQALAQCAEFIQKNNYITKECVNTAIAGKEVAEQKNPTLAAIASSDTADLYGLKIIESNINSSRNNTTRFAAFSRCANHPEPTSKMGEHFILVFTVLNEAGSLAKTLNIIGAHGFNMRNLKSRPMKTLMWNYYFFIELDGNIYTEDGKEMLKQLSTICDCLKLVGTYRSHM